MNVTADKKYIFGNSGITMRDVIMETRMPHFVAKFGTYINTKNLTPANWTGSYFCFGGGGGFTCFRDCPTLTILLSFGVILHLFDILIG